MRRRRLIAASWLGLSLAACSSLPLPASAGPIVHALTTRNELVSFHAERPQQVVSRRPLTGLDEQEAILGLGFDSTRRELLALSSLGRLYRIDTASAQATALGEPLRVPLRGNAFGVVALATGDIRLLSDAGQALRVRRASVGSASSTPSASAAGGGVAATPHASTASAPADGPLTASSASGTATPPDGVFSVSEGPALAYAPEDVNAGQAPGLVAAARLGGSDVPGRLYAIDAALGTLVALDEAGGAALGPLRTVGRLKASAIELAGFDIDRTRRLGYAALTGDETRASLWARVDLITGVATPLGPIGAGDTVRALALMP